MEEDYKKTGTYLQMKIENEKRAITEEEKLKIIEIVKKVELDSIK
mgnify:FL=1